MITLSGNEFTFYVTNNRNELWALMERNWADVRKYAKERGAISEDRRPEVVGLEGEDWGNIQSEEEDLSNCGWMIDREMVDDVGYKEIEGMKKEKWQDYFQKYGCLVEPIIMNEYSRLILQDGVPGKLQEKSELECRGSQRTI
jgi:hypothetical protein